MIQELVRKSLPPSLVPLNCFEEIIDIAIFLTKEELSMEYSTIISPLISLVSVIVGAVLGVRIAIFRDKKQEKSKRLRIRRLIGKEIQQNVDLRNNVAPKSVPDYLLFDIYQSNLGNFYLLEDGLLEAVLRHYKIVQRFDRLQHDIEAGKSTDESKKLQLANKSCESGEEALKLLGSD